ncbi:MAG: hypothetical protein VKJ05_04175 [Synechococcaceae cyanobacterium]|nr:hypothetical protein [Synechococcaceae cyanobacterium]
MGNELSFVNATGAGCMIYRETTGRYVVSREQEPRQQLRVATLAAAHAVCRVFERREQGEVRQGA